MIQITDKKDCCGCAACMQRCPKQCITLHEDAEGFLYPRVDTSLCVECGLCEQVCPVLHPASPRRPEVCYAAIHTDDRVRSASSSGGVFSAVATRILTEGGVVFGARFAEDWSVIHDCTETPEGLAPFLGSKYVQSRIGDAYRRAEAFLKAGRTVLFTGTPCQISGLRRYLRRDYPGLLTMDFICHGVPSPKVWRRYLDESFPGSARSALRAVSFRSKILGWHHFSLAFTLAGDKDTADRVQSRPFDQDPYMLGFLKDLYLRPSCYACVVKSCSSGADLTVGDFWSIGSYRPDLDDDRGVSSILVHTPAGVQALEGLPLRLYPATYEQARKYNSAADQSPKVPISRRVEFYARMEQEGVIPTATAMTYVPGWKRFMKGIRPFLGKVRRKILR